MSERDPRVDPRPGDRIKWKGWSIEIIKVRNAVVFYRCRYGAEKLFHPEAATRLQVYRGWAKDSTVSALENPHA